MNVLGIKYMHGLAATPWELIAIPLFGIGLGHSTKALMVRRVKELHSKTFAIRPSSTLETTLMALTTHHLHLRQGKV
jgi:hypothetical protein